MKPVNFSVNNYSRVIHKGPGTQPTKYDSVIIIILTSNYLFCQTWPAQCSFLPPCSKISSEPFKMMLCKCLTTQWSLKDGQH